MSRSVLEQLKSEVVVALVVAGRDWPRGFLSSTVIPDSWMGLVVYADGRRRYVPAGDEPRLDDDDELLLVRNRALVVPVDVHEAVSADGNYVDGECTLLVRWSAREDDLAALRGKLLHGKTLATDQLAADFGQGGAVVALRDFVKSHEAAKLVREDLREELLTHLRDALKRFCFESGATIERVAGARFQSEMFREREAAERAKRRRLERIAAREAVEQAALNATVRRLDDLSGVLAKLKSAASDESDMRWHDLLPALSPAERGRLLENLWRITPNQRTARHIVAVAGTEIVWLDPASPSEPTRRLTLPDELGGLRSTSFSDDANCLLIGAAQGVWAVDPDDPQKPPVAYAVPAAEPQRTGFNAACTFDDRMYATHSGLGCWRWSLQDPAEATAIFEPYQGTPRGIRAAAVTEDGQVVFAADDCVHGYSPETSELSTLCSVGAHIHALFPLEQHLYAGTNDGRLIRIELARPEQFTVVQRVIDPIESVSARRWNDLVELVIPAGPQGVTAVYADESIAVPLLKRGDVRRVWVSDDCVLALSAARDRLFVLSATAGGDHGVNEAPLARQIGHSIQDACLVV